MNDPRAPTDPIAGLSRQDQQIDRLLRDFFQSEMPEQFPNAPVVDVKSSLSISLWQRWGPSARRLAMAAAVGLVFLGYGVISSFFPHTPPEVNNRVGGSMGMSGWEKIDTPSGKAQIRQKVDDSRIVIEVEGELGGDPMLFPRP